jgi:hypothetical protein
MDRVRENIEEHDPQHVQLLDHLRSRLPSDAFDLVHFGAEFAREFHKDTRLYGGGSHYRHLLNAVDWMVRKCRVDDPFMILLLLFHDLWMNDSGDVLKGDAQEQLVNDNYLDEHADVRILALLEDRLRDEAKELKSSREPSLVLRLERSLPNRWPRHNPEGESYAFGKIPSWFNELLAFFLIAWDSKDREMGGVRLDLIKERVKRLQIDKRIHQEEMADGENPKGADADDTRRDLGRDCDRLDRHCTDLERRGCILEMAIQLSRLPQLPDDPHPPRAVREFEAIYRLLERIRHWVGDDMRPVLREAERELRSTADKIGTHLPIDWEG